MSKNALDFFELLDKFISDLERGKYLQKNGMRMKPGTIQNYRSMRTVVKKFVEEKSFELRIINLSKCTKQQFSSEQKYW